MWDRYDDFLSWDAQQDWLEAYFDDLEAINVELVACGSIRGVVVS